MIDLSDSAVVIFKTKTDTVIGLLESENSRKIKIKFPHVIINHPMTMDAIFVPYCSFTDEFIFEFKLSEIEYLVTASHHVSDKFLGSIFQLCINKFMNILDGVGTKYSSLLGLSFIDGNSTYH